MPNSNKSNPKKRNSISGKGKGLGNSLNKVLHSHAKLTKFIIHHNRGGSSGSGGVFGSLGLSSGGSSASSARHSYYPHSKWLEDRFLLEEGSVGSYIDQLVWQREQSINRLKELKEHSGEINAVATRLGIHTSAPLIKMFEKDGASIESIRSIAFMASEFQMMVFYLRLVEMERRRIIVPVEDPVIPFRDTHIFSSEQKTWENSIFQKVMGNVSSPPAPQQGNEDEIGVATADNLPDVRANDPDHSFYQQAILVFLGALMPLRQKDSMTDWDKWQAMPTGDITNAASKTRMMEDVHFMNDFNKWMEKVMITAILKYDVETKFYVDYQGWFDWYIKVKYGDSLNLNLMKKMVKFENQF